MAEFLITFLRVPLQAIPMQPLHKVVSREHNSASDHETFLFQSTCQSLEWPPERKQVEKEERADS